MDQARRVTRRIPRPDFHADRHPSRTFELVRPIFFLKQFFLNEKISAYNWLSATSLLPTDDATTARHAMLESLLASQQQVVTISADRAALEGTLVSTVPRSSTLVADVAAQMESVRSLQQSISTLQQMAQPALVRKV